MERVVPNALGDPRWFCLSIMACFFGMGTKEVMVSAPLMVFFYDCVFVAGNWRKRMER